MQQRNFQRYKIYETFKEKYLNNLSEFYRATNRNSIPEQTEADGRIYHEDKHPPIILKQPREEETRETRSMRIINRHTKHHRSINLNNRNTVESTKLHRCETLLDSAAPAHARNTITLLISTLYSRFNHTKHSPHIRSSAINLFPPASAYFPIRLHFQSLPFSPPWKSLSVSRKGIKRKEGKKRKTS